ncbi:hypothetical protein GCM10010215_59520 [Streptomyces virginiae]|uniref:Integral membrane protein n=1 Tax=Streptomyces virginiae TaxID=1961 RepID=A0ABQ3NTP0_STRVG|nr:hypothetical protein [Streptomyces virginiae]MBP2341151.1 hypothetical protein [Streptomyces virginiae]GGQ27325.1 hypothetical protein GCM10010215_59520 [Streptomyces virginiae]GHI16149.1 hypothetical protein Scinn_56120 [Streptomyces virginiae]
MSAAADATATVRRSGREAELLQLPSWCGAAAASLAVCAVWAATTWIALHLRADVTLHTVALFVHLASLVLGLGAVLAIDYYGALWLTGRKTLREVLDFTAPLHVPVWAGLGGLLFSGAFLHPDLSSPLTCVKLGLVLLLSLNGVQASALHQRLAAVDGGPVSRRLMIRGAVTASVSQAAWWGAVAIGFLNSRH